DGIRYFHVTGVQTCALPISFIAMLFFLVSCSAGSQTTERSGDSGTALAEQAVIEGNKGRAQDSEPWSEAQLMAPAELAALLEGEIGRAACRESWRSGG